MTSTLNYDDIRPYHDEELPSILETLLHDREFLRAIKSLRFGWMPNFLLPIVAPLMKFRLRKYSEEIKTVVAFQNAVKLYLQRCVNETADGFEVVGAERLQKDGSYLFISNHRDIVMDPALCNLALHRVDMGTCRIAVGDNLLSKEFAEHLMRINKSFIVKRAVGSGREKLAELKKLSSYIRSSLTQDTEHVWIAQKEGRAKNGMDLSDPTLIKMLALSKSKQQNFSEAITELNILPIAVSYEWDPCDAAKAKELASIERRGEYQKAEHEDITSIADGIQGYKGRVCLQFGSQLTGDFESAEDVAVALDQQIIQMYQIFPSHLAAYRLLNDELPSIEFAWSEQDIAKAETILKERSQELGVLESKLLLQSYANPIVNRLDLQSKGSS